MKDFIIKVLGVLSVVAMLDAIMFMLVIFS